MKFSIPWVTALAVLAIALPSRRVPLADAAPPADAAGADVAAAVVELEAAVKAKDDGAAAAAAKKVGGLYKGATDASVKTTIVKELCSLVKATKLPTARKTALDLLVATEDGATVWKGLASQYPKDDVDDPEKFNLEIIKAVGLLHPEGAIDLLLETYRKAKALDVSSAGITALGNYHKSKRRFEIFEEIVKAGKNMIPSRGGGKNPGAETQARWATMGGAIGKALDALTGNSIGDPTAWFKKADEAKKDYKSLFKE